ncbi:MAG: 1-acyl-sn-glycerol-3-phosphate acyltransferase, partial [Candidatus Cryptobacteroides sp.]
ASDKLVREIGCHCMIGNARRLDELPEGAFITISNHPYGAMDGILLLDIMLKKRPDFKVMVNQLLGRIEPLKPALVTVNPTTTEKKAPSKANLDGVRETLRHLQQGHPMGFFPSGAVSDLHPKTRDISDRQWQDSLVRLIKKARVPIVPVRFADRNSMFYYLLGLIDWKVRLLRLPSEVFNKNKGVHRVIIGETISVESQDSFTDIDAFRDFLRASVYGVPVPDELVPER